MDVDEILALERELTDEEFLFLESETLKAARELRQHIAELLPQVAAHDPALADRMELSSSTMVLALEAGAALPIGDKRAETAALKDLTRTVLGQRADAAPPAGLVRMPRRDRRRLRGRTRGRRPTTSESPQSPTDPTA